MKAKTKKILIVSFIVIAIVLLCWLLFFRKKGYEKLIENLNITKTNKEALKNRVKAIVSDSAFDKSYYEAAAARNKLSYDEYLVMEAAYQLGWTVGTTNGEIVVVTNKD